GSASLVPAMWSRSARAAPGLGPCRAISVSTAAASGACSMSRKAAMTAAARWLYAGSTVIGRAGEAGLEDGVDERDALVERSEGALHRVDGQPLQVGPVVTELPDQQGELVGEGDLGHQAVVGVDGNAELKLAQQP